MNSCVEAGMASDFQSASWSVLAKVLRFENVDIEKIPKPQTTNQKKKKKDFMFIVSQAVKHI